MPSNICNIAVANLWTTEKWFEHFEVEMHTDTSGNNRKAVIEIQGTWNASTGHFEQSALGVLGGAVIGTEYYLRSRVIGKYGAAPWSAWITEVAGDITAPNATYSATATAGGAGVEIDVTVYNPSADIDRYEWFWRKNPNDAWPQASDAPNLFGRGLSAFVVIQSNPAARFWIRAVDTSGNKQLWYYLGAWNSLAQYVFMKNTDTLGNIQDGDGYIKIADYGGGEVTVDNPNFDAQTAGWEADGSSTSIAQNSSSPWAGGGHSLRITTSGQYSQASHVRRWAIHPGDQFTLSYWGKSDGVFYLYGQLVWIDASGSLSYAGLNFGTGTSWQQKISPVLTAPANTVAMALAFPRGDTSGGAHSAWITGIRIIRLFNSSTVLNKQGSLVGAGDNSVFQYNASTTTIDIWNTAGSWPMPDGSTGYFNANGSSGSPAFTFSGLNSGVIYRFAGYVDLNNGNLTQVLRVPGTAGPDWFVQTLFADGHAVLFTNWQIATPSSGGSSGGGGVGGGGATCPAEDQLIETRELGLVPAGDLRPGDHVRGWGGEWNKVLEVRLVEGWLHYVDVARERLHVDINHHWLPRNVSPDAPIEKWIRSLLLKSGSYVRAANGKNSKVWRVGKPHWGRYVEIRAERQRFTIGIHVGHNYITYDLP